jgi:hypothetical protein
LMREYVIVPILLCSQSPPNASYRAAMVNNNAASCMDTKADHVQWPRLDETHLGSVRSFPARLRTLKCFPA